MNSVTQRRKFSSGQAMAQPPSAIPRVEATRAVNFRSMYCIALSLLIYLAFNFAANGGNGANRSFLLASAGGLLALAPLVGSEAGRVLGGSKLGLILVIVYAFNTFAAVGHFLYYIQPDYFSGNTDFVYFWDYMWLDQSLIHVANIWHAGGLFSPIDAEYWLVNKNAGLLAFMSLNYYVAGSFPLNIVPWNVLFTIYTAILISDMTRNLGGGRQQVSLALWVTLLLPFTFIASLMWRDTTGQFFIVLGAYLMVLTRSRKGYWVLLLPAASFLAYLHREPYLVIFFVAAILYFLHDMRHSKHAPVLVPLGILLLIALVPIAQQLSSVAFHRYSDADGSSAIGLMVSSGRVLGLPFRVIRAILGPFPWTGYSQQVDGYAYQPFEYLQSVLNLTMLVCALPLAWRLWKIKNELDLCTLLALIFFVMAVISTGIHTSYTSVGLTLLVPQMTRVGADQFLKTFGASLLFFIAANIIVVGMGFSGLNIMQNLSGGY